MGIKTQVIRDLGIHRAMLESHQSQGSKDFIPGSSAASNVLVRGSVRFLGEVCGTVQAFLD